MTILSFIFSMRNPKPGKMVFILKQGLGGYHVINALFSTGTTDIAYFDNWFKQWFIPSLVTNNHFSYAHDMSLKPYKITSTEVWLKCQYHIQWKYCLKESVEENHTLIARFVGPTWGPSGADRTQVGPILAPWTLLSGYATGDLFY